MLLPIALLWATVSIFSQHPREGFQPENRRTPEQQSEERSPDSHGKWKSMAPFLASPHSLKSMQEFYRLDSLLEEDWDMAASSYAGDFKAYYTYNEAGSLTEFRSVTRNDESGTWDPYDRETYLYDEESRLVLFTDYDLDESGTEWYDSWAEAFNYADGRLIETIEAQRDGPGEEAYPVWKTVFSYDESGWVTGTMEYIFLFDWELTWKTERTYSESGQLLTYTDFNDSDTDPSGWVYVDRETYSYDEENLLTEYVRIEWDEEAGVWVNVDREEFDLQSNGDVQGFIDFDWNEMDEQWEMNRKLEYTYKPGVTYEQLWIPWFYMDDIPNYFNSQLISYAGSDYESGEWVNAFRGTYFYTAPEATGLRTSGRSSFTLYPNPASSSVRLSADGVPADGISGLLSVELYDLRGKLLLRDQVVPEQLIDLKDVPEGIYLLRVMDRLDQPVGMEKIVIRK